MNDQLGFDDVFAPAGGEPQGSPPPRKAARQRAKRRRTGRWRTFVTMLVLLAVVGGAVYAAWTYVRPIIVAMRAPTDYTGAGTGSVTVKIPSGATGTDIGQVLQKAGVVMTAKAFAATAKDDSRSTSLQPGVYKLRKHMSSAAALEMLLDPDTRQVVEVLIREGLRATEIYDVLGKRTKYDTADFTAAAKKAGSWGLLPSRAKGRLEGFLFPATYDFTPDQTPTQILKAMVQQALDQMDSAGVAEKDRLRVMTTASLIEAEAGKASDMPKIARVLDNRMSRKIPLQLDTTVHYATGKFKLGTTYADLKVKSPYNTYTHKGLPPGPICSPGLAAIKASQSPAKGDWLYFVTVDPTNKVTKFATTGAQFQKLKSEWLAWLKAHPGS